MNPLLFIKRFPLYGKNLTTIEDKLNWALKQNINYSQDYILGYPGSAPLSIGVKSFKKFIKANPNNIGTHTRIESEAGFKGTQELEKEVIAMASDLFDSKSSSKIDGYLSSGGTESNIMALWILRNMIKYSYKKEAFFLKTSLTHYSIKKAFNLLKISNTKDITINKRTFGMDINDLKKKIYTLNSKGCKNLIIICTLGYTVTGSIDPIQEINFLTNELQKKLGIRIFIHIDAAFGGFIYPFLSKSKIGFNLKNVMTIGLDAHKTGLVPYLCGIFLCRKDLQKFIETKVDYIRGHIDDTLIGSRSGAMAATLWATIMSTGKKGYTKIYSKCLKNKLFFLNRLKKTNIPFWFFTNKFMNIIAIEFLDFPNQKLSRYIEEKYGLTIAKIPFGKEKKNVYKIIIMPHVKKSLICQFIFDLVHYKRTFKKKR